MPSRGDMTGLLVTEHYIACGNVPRGGDKRVTSRAALPVSTSRHLLTTTIVAFITRNMYLPVPRGILALVCCVNCILFWVYYPPPRSSLRTAAALYNTDVCLYPAAGRV